MQILLRKFGFVDSVVASAFFYTFVCFILASQFGAFLTDATSLASQIRDRNAAIALPIITSYLWMANYYLVSRTKQCLGSFADFMQQSFDSQQVNTAVKALASRNVKRAAVGGVLVAFGYLLSERLLTLNLPPLKILLNLIAFPFWIMVFMLILQLITITQFIIRQFLNNERIDLFGIKKITPMSELVVTNLMVSAFGLALVPLFWIGKPIPVIDKAIVTGVFLVMSFYLFWPVFKVQKQIANKKKLAIHRLNESMKRLFISADGKNRRLTDDPARLRKLSSLISTKRELSAASDWPVNLPQSIKGLVLVLSIPLSWVAGSLVESLIAQLALL